MLLAKRSMIAYTDTDGNIKNGVIVSNNACMRFSPVFQVVPFEKKENTYYAKPKDEVLIDREQVLTVLGLMRFREEKEICYQVLKHHLAEPNDRFKQGEIWYCDMPEEDGSIQCGKRPVLIASAEVTNNMVHVIPLTSKMKKLEQPTHVLLKKEESNLKRDSLILAEAETAVNKSYFLDKVGCVSTYKMEEILEAVKVQRNM